MQKWISDMNLEQCTTLWMKVMRWEFLIIRIFPLETHSFTHHCVCRQCEERVSCSAFHQAALLLLIGGVDVGKLRGRRRLPNEPVCVCVCGGRRAVEDSCCQGAKDRLSLTPVCWITLSSVWCRKDKEQTLKKININPALRLLLTSLPALSDNINRDRNWEAAFKLRWEKWGVCWAAREINKKGKKPHNRMF